MDEYENYMKTYESIEDRNDVLFDKQFLELEIMTKLSIIKEIDTGLPSDVMPIIYHNFKIENDKFERYDVCKELIIGKTISDIEFFSFTKSEWLTLEEWCNGIHKREFAQHIKDNNNIFKKIYPTYEDVRNGLLDDVGWGGGVTHYLSLLFMYTFKDIPEMKMIYKIWKPEIVYGRPTTTEPLAEYFKRYMAKYAAYIYYNKNNDKMPYSTRTRVGILALAIIYDKDALTIHTDLESIKFYKLYN